MRGKETIGRENGRGYGKVRGKEIIGREKGKRRWKGERNGNNR
jgi:hypothetical protein